MPLVEFVQPPRWNWKQVSRVALTAAMALALVASACSSHSASLSPDSAAGDAMAEGGHRPDSQTAPTVDASRTESGSATVSCGMSPAEYTSGDGSVTFYTLAMAGGAVECGFAVLGTNPDTIDQVATGAGHYFGAMNTADYDKAAVCGACVEVTRDSTRTVALTIVDECPTASNPKCKTGHIDLSEEAFLQIGTADEGYLGTGNGGAVGVISWKYIPCPVTGGLTIEVKAGSNQYFTQFLVENHRYQLASLEVKVGGAWSPATRASYNYWQVGDGNLGAGPYDVRVADINGSVVEQTVTLQPGVAQPTTGQFPLCK